MSPDEVELWIVEERYKLLTEEWCEVRIQTRLKATHAVVAACTSIACAALGTSMALGLRAAKEHDEQS